VTAAAEVSRRVLADPGRAPSGLSVRFLVLMLLVLVSTASIYGYLWLGVQPDIERAAAGCLSATDLSRLTALDPVFFTEILGDTGSTLGCSAGFAPGLATAEMAGPGLVLICAWLAYRSAPGWRRRYPNGFWRVVTRRARTRGRMSDLAFDPVALARVEQLCGQVDLHRPPVIVVDPLGTDACVFGTTRTPYLCLPLSLVSACRTDPDRFSAVVLHELGHVRNRDNRATYLTTTAWWSFVVLAVVPYLLLTVVSGQPLDNLRATLSVATLTAVVYLTWLATLRTREVQADATAGQHDPDGVFVRYLNRDNVEPPSRRPAALRAHPPLALRRAVASDPAESVAVPVAQLFGAGLGLAVLSDNLTNLFLHALVATGRAGDLSVSTTTTTFVIFGTIAAANLLPVTVLAWLITVVAWRSRLRGLARPGRTPTVRIAVALTAGLVLGEPMAVSSANTGRWGILDGIGDRNAGTALVSALAVFALLAAAACWSWESAAAWLPVARGSLRRSCGIAAGLLVAGVLPWYAVWWVMHDTPLAGRLFLMDEGFAPHAGLTALPLPAAPFVQAKYIPLDFLAATPGVAVLLALPLLGSALGAVPWSGRRGGSGGLSFPPIGPRFRAVVTSGLVGGAAAALAGVILAEVIHDLADPARFDGPLRADAIVYLVDVASDVTALTAAVVAGLVAGRGLTAGALAGLITTVVGAITAPGFALVALCGWDHAGTCAGPSLGDFYRLAFSVTGLAMPVRGTIAALAAAGLVIAAGAIVRRPRPAPPPVSHRHHPPTTTFIASGLILLPLVLAFYWFVSSP